MNSYTGTNFDDFLAEEGILEEVSVSASKRRLALQVAGTDTQHTFASLKGIWQGTIVDEHDFEVSRLTNPKFP